MVFASLGIGAAIANFATGIFTTVCGLLFSPLATGLATYIVLKKTRLGRLPTWRASSAWSSGGMVSDRFLIAAEPIALAFIFSLLSTGGSVSAVGGDYRRCDNGIT